MSKRPADDGALAPNILKRGDRPAFEENGNGTGEFEGEYEDEYSDEMDSEDEIFEAGVDGQPDAERETAEKGR